MDNDEEGGSGRAPRSDRKSLLRRRPAAAGGCRGNARPVRCCDCSGARIWRQCRACSATRPESGEALENDRL